MAGKGFAPKDPSRRAGHHGKTDLKIIEFHPTSQPSLPEDWDWPEETLQWWKMWAQSALSDDFSETDWSFLLDTAILHAKLWGDGDTTVLPELRVRVAKFGATPEDRARLRIQFATADDTELRRDRNQTVNSTAARNRLKAVKTIDAA